MKIAVLGTGVVGETIGSRLIALGHEVKMGSRSATNEKAGAWVKKAGAKASQGTFADAAAFGALAFNCTKGTASLDALKAAGADNLRGKVLIDLANALDFSKGYLTVSPINDDSLGEQLQRAFPETKVVKSLNTMNCEVMLDPAKVPGDHSVFVSGNDEGAKAEVKTLLTSAGWKDIIDLGDLSTARGTEALLHLWLRTYGALKSPNFNFKVVR